MQFPFDSIKASEVAAAFLKRAGGKMCHLKLMKLIYLLDRKSIEMRGRTVVGGNYYSMKHGPVIEELLDLINFGDDGGIWSQSIRDREDHAVALQSDPGTQHLAQSELRLMDELWDEFGKLTKWELVHWTHDHLTEWERRTSGRSPIPVESVSKAVGLSDCYIKSVVEEAQNSKMMAEIFA